MKYLLKNYRIIALRDFGNVKVGDVGGWINSEENLSHKGLAWVYGNAHVSGDAWVSGNARVFGDARVYDKAQVYGNAEIFGNARVYGDVHVGGHAGIFGAVHVYENARVFGDARVSGAARVGGSTHIGGHSCVIGNAFFCTYSLGLSINAATDPANKDHLLRALLTIYKENPGRWSAQIGLFIDELHQQGVRYSELRSIQKSCRANSNEGHLPVNGASINNI